MEKNAQAFVVNPKRDFIRKSELSFSKTMRFILGMGSQALGKELMDFLTQKQYPFQLWFSGEPRYFLLLFRFYSINSMMFFPRPASFMAIDFTLLTVLIFIFQRFLMIMAHITVPTIFQKVII